jgi:hypothetical protein
MSYHNVEKYSRRIVSSLRKTPKEEHYQPEGFPRPGGLESRIRLPKERMEEKISCAGMEKENREYPVRLQNGRSHCQCKSGRQGFQLETV